MRIERLISSNAEQKSTKTSKDSKDVAFVKRKEQIIINFECRSTSFYSQCCVFNNRALDKCFNEILHGRIKAIIQRQFCPGL